MEKNNYPVVDISEVRRKYQIIDISNLDFKRPNNSDALQQREFYGTDDEILSLKTSIKERGLLEAPIVMEDPEDTTKFRVLEGNRRCYAVTLLLQEGATSTPSGKSISKIRCEVRPSVLSMVSDYVEEWKSLNTSAPAEEVEDITNYVRNQVMAQLGADALTRNSNRLNWSPVEQSRSIKLLLDSGVDIKVICAQTGYSENTLKARLSLLSKEAELPDVIEALDKGTINYTVGKLLSNVKDVEARKELLSLAEEGKSSSEIKEIIDTKEEASKKSGGGGIKTQHRAKSSAASASTKTLGVRKESALLEAISQLAEERALLVDSEDDDGVNLLADVDAAIKVLQWVLNPLDDTKIYQLFLADN